MATFDEISKLKREIAEVERTKADSIAAYILKLKGRSVSELIELKQYWEIERKKYRAVDHRSTQKRLDAGYWLEAIDQLLITEGRPKEIEKIPVPNPDNMSVADTAEYLGISESTLYKMTSQKTIPFHKIGKKKLGFKKAELDEYIDEHRTITDEEVEKQAERYIAGSRSSQDRKRK